MCLASTFKNNFQNTKNKNDVWETISIFDIKKKKKKNLQKVTCRICRLPFFSLFYFIFILFFL